MSEQQKPARPPQVTMAGVVAIFGGVLLVFGLFEAMEQLRTSDMRDSITEFLSEPPGDGLGLTLDNVLALLRVLVFVNAALAAASVVLGVFILQRHNPARIVFTIAAALMLLTAPVSGGLLPFITAFAAAMLWTRPARDWFAGREPAVVERTPTRPERRPDGPPPYQPPPPPEHSAGQDNDSFASQPPVPASDDAPQPSPAAYPFGQKPGDQVQQQLPGDQPTYPQGQAAPYPAPPPQQGGWPAPAQGQWPPPSEPPVQPAGRAPGKRPGTVLTAVVLTWAFAGITFLGFLALILMLAGAQDQLLEELRADQSIQELNLSTQDLVSILWVMSAVILVWCLSAMVLAFLVFRGIGWARIVLAVSAGAAALFSLAAAPAGLLHTAAAIATGVLMFVGGAGEWFSRGGGSHDAHGGPPYDAPRYGGPYDQAPPPPPPPKQKPPSNVW